jgi:uncharacterized C2H2 Zn-finger protein/predicted nucleic acid binding AN1-type Zn finger protein
MDVGSHCAKSDCQQVDFLPFTCDCCASVFCLEHRSYDAHACPNAGSRDRRVVQCPLCKQMIRWTPEQDVNVVWEQHVYSGQCVPNPQLVGKNGELKTEKKKKPRCSAERCREILLASNQFHCNKCGLDVCLKHRFESDHDCATVSQRRRQQQRNSFFSRPAATSTATQASASINTAKLQQNAKAAATSVVNNTRSAVTSLVQKGKAAAASVTTTSEECPICQQKFAYVSQLIAHVNRSHPEIDTRAEARTHTPAPAAPSTGSSTTTGREVCPQCRTVFSDAAALIAHVESAHAGGAATQVAASGGASGHSSDEKCLLM